jgi:hypothetical protein
MDIPLLSFFLKKDRFSDLAGQFEFRLRQFEKEISLLKKAHPVLAEPCLIYIEKAKFSIKLLRRYKDEKTAIEIIHLYYCLEDELSDIKKKLGNIGVDFNISYMKFKKRMDDLQKQKFDVTRASIQLSGIEKRLQEVIISEKDAIEILHACYLMDTVLNSIEAEKPSSINSENINLDEKM